ncbi:unnamed protein product [Pedinophyceae sp. YPF-701]|nr:unnamed protein product [Pedinophyceae sp. YPF-701]
MLDSTSTGLNASDGLTAVRSTAGHKKPGLPRCESWHLAASRMDALVSEKGSGEEADMMKVLSTTDGAVNLQRLKQVCARAGIQWGKDARLTEVFEAVDRAIEAGGAQCSPQDFYQMCSSNLLLLKEICESRLVIPDFEGFCHKLSYLHNKVLPNKSGANADYIAVLRDAESERFGVAVCTVDGQRWETGETNDYFTIQSTSKPITYAMAVTERGRDFTHSYVGQEPSGRPFNDHGLMLDGSNRPYNPMVNQGALMTAGVVASGHRGKAPRAIVQHIMDTWAKLCGNVGEVKYGQVCFESEKEDAHNNWALSWILAGKRGLPDCGAGAPEVEEMLDTYLGCCSIEVTCAMMSVAAATLANGGKCPITGVQVFSPEVVKMTLTLMATCGMYDGAGRFLFETGLPAKSGVSGVVMTVIPNVMGLATFSPRLDANGNSVRGVAFNQALVDMFTFHQFDNLSSLGSGKVDPRLSEVNHRSHRLRMIQWGIQSGDKHAKEFFAALRRIVSLVAVIDGEVVPGEVEMCCNVLHKVLGVSVGKKAMHDECEAALKEGVHGLDELIPVLQKLGGSMDEVQAEITLESMFCVAAADGAVTSQEREAMQELGAQLGLPPYVVDMKLTDLQAELKVEVEQAGLSIRASSKNGQVETVLEEDGDEA